MAEQHLLDEIIKDMNHIELATDVYNTFNIDRKIASILFNYFRWTTSCYGWSKRFNRFHRFFLSTGDRIAMRTTHIFGGGNRLFSQTGRVRFALMIRSALVFISRDYPDLADTLLYSEMAEQYDDLFASWPTNNPPLTGYAEMVFMPDNVVPLLVEAGHSWWRIMMDVKHINGREFDPCLFRQHEDNAWINHHQAAMNILNQATLQISKPSAGIIEELKRAQNRVREATANVNSHKNTANEALAKATRDLESLRGIEEGPNRMAARIREAKVAAKTRLYEVKGTHEGAQEVLVAVEHARKLVGRFGQDGEPMLLEAQKLLQIADAARAQANYGFFEYIQNLIDSLEKTITSRTLCSVPQ